MTKRGEAEKGDIWLAVRDYSLLPQRCTVLTALRPGENDDTMLGSINWPLALALIPAGLFYALFGGLLIRQQMRAGPKRSPAPKLDPRILVAMTVTLTGAIFFTCLAIMVLIY